MDMFPIFGTLIAVMLIGREAFGRYLDANDELIEKFKNVGKKKWITMDVVAVVVVIACILLFDILDNMAVAIVFNAILGAYCGMKAAIFARI